MGLNWVTSSGTLTSGMRVMKVLFRDLSKEPKWKKAWVELNISYFTTVQYSWKEKDRILSGPGALWAPNWNTSISISSFEIGLSNWWTCCWLNLGIGRVLRFSRMDSKELEFDSWNLSLKCFTNKSSISSILLVLLPSSLLSSVILFLALLWFIIFWKYLVFLSPWIIQLLLAFWAHLISSLSIKFSRSSLRSFSFLTLSLNSYNIVLRKSYLLISKMDKKKLRIPCIGVMLKALNNPNGQGMG